MSTEIILRSYSPTENAINSRERKASNRTAILVTLTELNLSYECKTNGMERSAFDTIA